MFFLVQAGKGVKPDSRKDSVLSLLDVQVASPRPAVVVNTLAQEWSCYTPLDLSALQRPQALVEYFHWLPPEPAMGSLPHLTHSVLQMLS